MRWYFCLVKWSSSTEPISYAKWQHVRRSKSHSFIRSAWSSSLQVNSLFDYTRDVVNSVNHLTHCSSGRFSEHNHHKIHRVPRLYRKLPQASKSRPVYRWYTSKNISDLYVWVCNIGRSRVFRLHWEEWDFQVYISLIRLASSWIHSQR